VDYAIVMQESNLVCPIQLLAHRNRVFSLKICFESTVFHVLKDKAIPGVTQYPNQPFVWANATIDTGFFGNVQDVVFHFSVRKWRFEDGTIIKEFDNPS